MNTIKSFKIFNKKHLNNHYQRMNQQNELLDKKVIFTGTDGNIILNPLF